MEPCKLIEEDSEFELFLSDDIDDDDLVTPFPDELEAAADEEEDRSTCHHRG